MSSSLSCVCSEAAPTGCFSFYLFVLFCFLIITRHLNAGMKINDVVVVAVDIGIDSMDYYYF